MGANNSKRASRCTSRNDQSGQCHSKLQRTSIQPQVFLPETLTPTKGSQKPASPGPGVPTNTAVTTASPPIVGGLSREPDSKPEVSNLITSFDITTCPTISNTSTYNNHLPVSSHVSNTDTKNVKPEETPNIKFTKNIKEDNNEKLVNKEKDIEENTNNSPIKTSVSPLTRKPLSPTPLFTDTGKCQIATNPIFPHTPPINDTIVVFDLETTGLPIHSDICQIAAQVLGENKIWSSYLVPSKNISPGASKVNGLSVGKDEMGRRVLMRGQQVLPAEGYIAGLKLFYRYLCQISKRCRKYDLNARVILLAHNAKRFDAPILLNAFRRISVTSQKFDKLGICFADSLLLLREIQKKNPTLISHRKPLNDEKNCLEGLENKKISLSLKSLHQHFFNEGFHAHDASNDVRALRRVLFQSPLSLPEAFIANNTFNPQEV